MINRKIEINRSRSRHEHKYTKYSMPWQVHVYM